MMLLQSGSPPPLESGRWSSPDPADLVVAALRTGGCAVVSGPAGIGKSRTLRLVAHRLRSDGGHVIEVQATASLAAVPFGALLSLLVAAGRSGHGSRTETALAMLVLLRQVGDLVLLVDDAHLLDVASAGLVHQAALDGTRVAVSLRDGEHPADAIERFGQDLGAVAVVVPRLSESATEAMLVETLGAPVDDLLTRVVHRRSAGLPLAVQALARVARTTGAAGLIEGEWRLRGRIPVSDELAALMRSTISGLDDEALRAAELVALAEGLTEAQLVALRAIDGAERAEAHAVLAMGPGGVLSLAHPLHLDALLADMPHLRRRRRLAQLIDAIDEPDSIVVRLRRVEWRLELGRPVAPAELLELVDVTAADDPERAERFARAAVAAGGGVRSQLRLAEVLAHLHRADEAESVLAGIEPATLDADSGMSADLTRAFLLVFALARPDDALSLLAPLPDAPMVAALRSTAHCYAGRLERAVVEASVVAEQQGLPAGARAHAALTRASALAILGDHERFVSWMPIAHGLVDGAEASIPEARESLRLLEGIDALRTLQDPTRAERIATRGYRGALARGDDGERTQWLHQLGEAALLLGDVDSAVDLLHRAARNRGRWASTTGGWVRGTLVRALALAGRQQEALQELAELRAIRVVPILQTEVALADAELIACGLDLKGAARIADRAARSQQAGRVDAWYAAMRFGGAGAAAAFLQASSSCSSPGRAAQRRHAQAVLDHDPRALEAASEMLAEARLGWYAIDAMAQAVRAFSRSDPDDPAPGERLRRLAAGCPSLHSPLVAALHRPALTEREAQVARLVADGETARAIAERLGVGVRTVETHIGHSYRKLGVRSATELRSTLHAPDRAARAGDA